MKKLRACLMGATGLVGQQFVRILDNHPYFDLVALTGSERSVGRTYCETIDWFLDEKLPESAANQIIIETKVNSILKNDIDLIFNALPSGLSSEIEKSLVKEDTYVFTNASCHRMDPNVPILSPEINPSHLNIVKNQNFSDKGFIVTNSNCTASGLVFGLKPLVDVGIKQTIVTTYQALSGAGRRGVPSLDILSNVVPYIQNEEEKLEEETKKILGEFDGNKIISADFYVNASCARVPVKNGHLESVVVELEEEIEVKDVLKLFNDFNGEPQALKLPTSPKNPIKIVNPQNRPQPARDLDHSNLKEDKGMAVTIGRVRKKNNWINFFLLVHNTIRGAAGASVLNAEFAYAKNFLK